MEKQAKLMARFILDNQGRPMLIERDNHKHYWINLYVEGAPDNTYAVNYQLHESYPDPLRESRQQNDGFVEKLTSYGDYTVQARLRTKNRVEVIASELSEALARGYGDKVSPIIGEALDDIKKY